MLSLNKLIIPIKSPISFQTRNVFFNPLVYRNHQIFHNFETSGPKEKLGTPPVIAPFTVAKQKHLARIYEEQFPLKLYHGKPIDRLSELQIRHGGRNDKGRVTTRGRGGENRKRMRVVDYKRQIKDRYARVLRIEYAADRTAHLALIQYDDGVLSYIIAPLTLRPGDRVMASTRASITPGNALPLRKVPVGTVVHNVEFIPGAGGKLARAAGTHALVISKDNDYAVLKLKSTEIRKIPLDSWCTIGQVGNIERAMRVVGKASIIRFRGHRPIVRGVAENSTIAHPHGGGNGSPHEKYSKQTKWGIFCCLFKTRGARKPYGYIVKKRIAGRFRDARWSSNNRQYSARYSPFVNAMIKKKKAIIASMAKKKSKSK